MNREAEHIEQDDEIADAFCWRRDNCIQIIQTTLRAELRLLNELNDQMHAPHIEGVMPVGRTRLMAEIDFGVASIQSMLERLDP